jgi:adenylate kinase family enzyme
LARRIHITGASGSGTSTLARELASRLASQAFDTDDFYWIPSDPPFTQSRPVLDRLRLMEEVFLPRSDWVLSGSLHSWGSTVMSGVTHVVFLTLSAGQRLARLRTRERRRYGPRIAPGGDLEAMHRGFLAWAMSYDEPGAEGRSRQTHEAWLATLAVPVVRLEADVPPQELADRVLAVLDARLPAE